MLTETSQDARVVKLECFLNSVSSVSPSFRCFSLSAHCCAPTPFLKAGDLLTFFVRRRFTQLQTFSVTQKSQRRPGACSQCASRVYKIPRVFPMHVRKLNRSNRVLGPPGKTAKGRRPGSPLGPYDRGFAARAGTPDRTAVGAVVLSLFSGVRALNSRDGLCPPSKACQRSGPSGPPRRDHGRSRESLRAPCIR